MDDFLVFFSRKDVKEFIQENVESNVQDLLLNPPKVFQEEAKWIAEQIISRQKIKKKLPTWYEDLDLIMPPPVSAEQASSLATCHYKATLLRNSGLQFADLTGGMGVDCLYLSESFDDVTYVEANAHLCDVFRYNAEQLKRNIKVVNAPAEEFLKSGYLGKSRMFYLDPDRRSEIKNRAFKIEDCSPNLHQILPLLKDSEFRMLVKFSPLLDLSVILESFSQTSAIHIISVKNDCKEVLVDMQSAAHGEPLIYCVNLETDQPVFSFLLSEEKNCAAELGGVEEFIYEPNASVMKAGAFNSVAVQHGLKKVGQNTHLYTTDKQVQHFPGRTFRMLQKVTKDSLKQYAADGKINVLVRNHPLTTQQIKSKWKVKDGGAYFILGYRDHQNKPQLRIAEKLSTEDNAKG